MIPRAVFVRVAAVVSIAGCTPPTASQGQAVKSARSTHSIPQPSPTTTSPSDAFARSSPPPPETQALFLPPAIRASELPNGMRVLVIEQNAAPFVAASVVVRGGAAGFPAIAPAALWLMPRTALPAEHDECTTLSSLDQLMVDPTFAAEADHVAITIRSPANSFDSALEVLAGFMVTPKFESGRVERMRQRMVAFGAADASDLSRLARATLYSTLFGAAHPYGRLRRAFEADADRTGRDDVERAWRASAGPRNAMLIVAGGVDAAHVESLANKLFGRWSADRTWRMPTAPPPAAPDASAIVIVDRPGAERATLVYGAVLAPIDSPMFAADLVLREVLSELKSASWQRALHERLGRGAAGTANLDAHLGGSVYWWEANVAPEDVANTLSDMATALRQLQEQGPNTSQISDAKARVLGSTLQSFETTEGIVNSFIPAGYGAAVESVQDPVREIDALGVSDLSRAIPHPETMKAVVVADAHLIRASLEALHWGKVQVLQSNGRATPRPGSVAAVSASSGGCSQRCTGFTVSADLRHALQQRAGGSQVSQCYQSALTTNPSLRGRVTLAIRIGPEGNVCSSTVAANETGSADLGKCAADAIRAAGAVPAPFGGCVDVSFPISFAPPAP